MFEKKCAWIEYTYKKSVLRKIYLFGTYVLESWMTILWYGLKKS